MTAVATPEQLERYIQAELDEGQRAEAEEKIADAWSFVQNRCGQTLSRATTTILIAGTSDPERELPERPVISVASVKLDGVLVPESEWYLLGSRLIRRNGWGGRYTQMEVVYTHGFDPLPDDLVAVVVRQAARTVENPQGLYMLSAAGTTQTFDSQGSTAGPRILSGDDEKILRRYRRTAHA